MSTIADPRAPALVYSEARVGQGKNIFVHWSDAVPGQNNSIEGYKVYYGINTVPDGTGIFYSVQTTATFGSVSLSFPGLRPGDRVYFRVVTKGVWSESILSTSSPVTIINTTPTVHSLSVDNPVVPATGSQNIRFYVDAIDNDGDIIYARFYRQDGTYLGVETTTSVGALIYLSTSDLPENYGSSPVSHTFYVRVTDAYENWANYNQASVTITRAVGATITGITVTAGNTPSYRTLTDDNTQPFCTLINASYTYSGSNIGTQWYYRTGSTASAAAYGTAYTLSNDTNLVNFNIAGILGFNQFYQIGVQITGSSIMWKTSGYTSGNRTSTAFYMAPIIEILNKSNRTSPVTSFNPTLLTYSNTSPTDFSTQIAVSHTFNSLYTTTFLWNTTNSMAGATAFNNGFVGQYGENLSFPNSVPAFNVTVRTPFYIFCRTSVPGASSVSTSFTMTKIIANPLVNSTLIHGIAGGRIKPISMNSASSYNPTFTQFWGSQSLSNFNMPSDWTNFSLHLSVNGMTKLIHQGGPSNIPGSLSPDTRIWPYTGAQLYDWSINSLGLSFNVEYSASLQLHVKDFFDTTYVLSSTGFVLDLREPPLFTTETGKAIKYNRGTGDIVISINNDVIINEGNKLTFTIPTARTYNNTNLTYRLEISRNTSRLVDIRNGSYTLYRSYPPTPLQDSTLNLEHTVLSISEPRFCYFRVVAIDSAGQSTILYFDNYTLLSGRLQQLTMNNLALTNGSIDETQTSLSFNYLLNDAGGGLSSSTGSFSNFDNGQGLIKIEAEYSSDGQIYTTYDTPLYNAINFTTMGTAIQSTTRNYSLTLPKITSSFVHVRLKVTTQTFTGASGGIIIPVYISYSNILVVPNVQPTVAYRKSHVGINNQEFEEDDVLVVNIGQGGGINGRHVIRLTSANWEGRINLITGEIDGFIVDGGSWN